MVDPSPFNLARSYWNQSLRKSFEDTPAWMQCLVLCLPWYDYVLHYHPGKEMTLPDICSYFKPKPGSEITFDIAIHHAHLSPV